MGYYNGAVLKESKLKRIGFPKTYSLNKDDAWSDDVVVLETVDPVCDQWYGLERRTYEEGYIQEYEPVSQIAYSNDQCSDVPCQNDKCSLQGLIDMGAYFNVKTDCFDTHGSSGSCHFINKTVEVAGVNYTYPYCAAINHGVLGSSTFHIYLACETALLFDMIGWFLQNQTIEYTDLSKQPPVPELDPSFDYENCCGLIDVQADVASNELKEDLFIVIGVASGFIGATIFFGAIIFSKDKCRKNFNQLSSSPKKSLELGSATYVLKSPLLNEGYQVL